jgi:hypothetical protein
MHRLSRRQQHASFVLQGQFLWLPGKHSNRRNKQAAQMHGIRLPHHHVRQHPGGFQIRIEFAPFVLPEGIPGEKKKEFQFSEGCSHINSLVCMQ